MSRSPISWPMSGRRHPPPLYWWRAGARVDLLARVAASAARLSQRRERVQQALEQRLDLAGRQLRSPGLVHRQERVGRVLWPCACSAPARCASAAPTIDSTLPRPGGASRRWKGRASNCSGSLRLARGGAAVLAQQSDRLDAGGHKLELVSPQSVLVRGYSILQRADGEVVRSAGQVSVGEPLRAALARRRTLGAGDRYATVVMIEGMH